MINLSIEQLNFAIENREFSADILNSSKNVVIVLTQDWCGQWIRVKKYLNELSLSECKIYYSEYNNMENFEEFMGFKENFFKNRYVPYIRFYKNGKFKIAVNYVGESEFLRLLGE